MCFQFKNCFTFYKENFTSFYALWAPGQVVWGSPKKLEKKKKSQKTCHYPSVTDFHKQKFILQFSR